MYTHTLTHTSSHKCTHTHSHTHKCTHISAHSHTHVHTYSHSHKFTQVHTHTLSHTQVHTHTRAHTYAHTFTHTSAHTHEHTHAHTLSHTYTHIYMYTCTHTCYTHTRVHIHLYTRIYVHRYGHYTTIHNDVLLVLSLCVFVASQLWCLAKMLPLMIGQFIIEDEEHWENFLLLLSITDFIFGPTVSQDFIPYLKEAIQEHHVNFSKLYSSAPITPKLHYMIHLPEWLLRYIYYYECIVQICDYLW